MVRKVFILSLLLLFVSGYVVAQTVIIQECKDTAGNLNTTFFQQGGDWYIPGTGSSAKSTAPGLIGQRTEFSTNGIIDATFAFLPEFGGHEPDSTNPVAFNAGLSWDVYITTPAAASIDATNSVYIISSDGSAADYTGTVPLVGSGDPDGSGPTGNKWYLLEADVSFAASGGYVEVQENSPQGDRFYADSVRYVEHLTGPTPTPTLTPTPRPTAVSISTSALYLIDDGDAGFSTEGLSWFPITEGYNGDSIYRDNKVKVGVPSATASWSFTGVAPGSYAIGFYLPQSIGWDYTKYIVTCPNTALDTVVYGNGQSASQEFNLLLNNVSLDGDVDVMFINKDDGITYGTRFYADAVGIFDPVFIGPTATPTNTPIISGVENSWRDYR